MRSVSRGSCERGNGNLFAASNWRSERFRVEKRPIPAASPKVSEDDHTRYCRVCTPQRGEGVPFELHYNQENRQVRGTEDYHCPYFREKQRTARCYHIQQSNSCIVCSLIDVHDTISFDVHMQWVSGQCPQNVECRCSSEHEKRQHTPATLHVRLEQKHTQWQQERQKPLRIEHERRSHVMRHRR